MKTVAISAGYLILFVLLAEISLALNYSPRTVFWYVPSNLSFALLILFGAAYSPLVFISVLLVAHLVYQLPLNIYLVGIGLFSTFGYTLSAEILRRVLKDRPLLSSLRDVTVFIIPAIFTPLLLAGVSVSLLALGGVIPTLLFAPSLFQMWVTDTLGNITLVPLLIQLAVHPFPPTPTSADRESSSRRAWLRTELPIMLLQFTAILLSLWLVYGMRATDDRRIWYLVFLPLIWVILEYGFRGATVAVTLISAGSLVAVRLLRYPLANYDDLHIFMLMLSLTGLITGAAFSELRRTDRRLRSRLDMESRITAISTRFINLSGEQIDREINQAMQNIGEFCQTDASHFLLFSREAGPRKILRAYQWSRSQHTPRDPRLEGMSMTGLPWLIAKLERGEVVNIPSPESLPDEAQMERDHMRQHNIYSMITVPVLLGNHLIGSLGFHSQTQEIALVEEDIRLLSLLGEIFLNVLERQRVESLARESDRKFRSIVLQSQDGITIVNEHGQVIEWNAGMERISGYSRAQMLGRPIWEVQLMMTPRNLQSPELLEKIKTSTRQAQQQINTTYINRINESTIERPDGELRITQMLIFPFQANRASLFAAIVRDVTELRKGEEELRRSQANLSEAERLAHLGHFMIEIPSGRISWSEETYRILDWPAGEAVPELKAVIQFIYPDDRQKMLEMVNLVLQDKTHFDLEYRIIVSNGGIKYIHTISQPVLNPQGEVERIFGTIMDITERKQSEQALRESESRYRELADSVSDVFFGLDNSLCITYWNRASEVFTGLTSDKAIGKSLFDLFPNLKGSSIEQFVLESFRTRQQQGFIMEYRSGKKKLYLEVNTYPSQNGISVFLRDVTERQTANERLRQSEARYRAVVEDQTDIICRYSPSGQITFANEAYCRIFGRPRKELIGQRFLRLQILSHSNGVSGQFTTLRGASPLTYESQMVLPDGKARWFQWTDRPIFNDEGKIIEYQSVGRDISESKRLEDELRYLSTHDALTGIYNRSFFETELARLQRARQWPVSILIADVNGLKRTNDTRGHPAGDDLLKQAARVLCACFRPEDIVARFGGDEFVVLLPATGANAAEEILQRVRSSLAAFNSTRPGEPLSLSIGIATGEKGQSLLEVLNHADSEMYDDKDRQKGTGELSQP